MPSCGVCPSVRVSVYVRSCNCVEISKYIFSNFFLRSGSGRPTILVLLFQSIWQYSFGERPNGGAESGV